METMDPKATDFSAQLAKIKASGGDTLFVTTAVEQITLILKQAKDQQLTARIITTGGSNSPDQLIAAGRRCGQRLLPPGVLHALVPRGGRRTPRSPRSSSALWNEKGHDVGGLTEGFRGWDGVCTSSSRPSRPPARRSRRRSRKALWDVKVKGINGDIAFIKQGPAGQGERAERAERLPRQDRGRQGRAAVAQVSARECASPASARGSRLILARALALSDGCAGEGAKTSWTSSSSIS